MKWINHLASRYLKRLQRDIDYFRKNPAEVQMNILREIVQQAKNTEFGKRHRFLLIEDPNDFARQVPVSDYEMLKPDIERMMHGAADVLWPGRIDLFAKSSGTTQDKSKFIPVSHENLKECHYKSSWDSVALLYERKPDMQMFTGKNLVMGGSLSTFGPYPDTTYGDVSAIMVQNMPLVGRPFYTPDFETALLADWDEKIDRMAKICSKENISTFGGVPTWTIVLFRRILELTGKSNMLEVWPDVRAYLHGGVGFKPYRQKFREFLPSDDFTYHEIYNASEGFFACQDRSDPDMLLLLENGMYFEFIPESEWEKENPEAVPIWDVELDRQYGLVVSNNSGLWRYTPGDTIRFTSIKPYRIQITGRIQQFINAFGEEVMISNTDQAIALTSEEQHAVIRDYTVAPVYFEGNRKARHQWVIEFETPPRDILEFTDALDRNLQSLNSDYEAKRYQDMALENLEIVSAPAGTFDRWLERKGKLGGQHKVPRLSNHRKVIDEVLSIMQSVTP